jgi:hypothetical protein
VYAGVTRSRDRAREQTEGAHAAALVLQRMADELASSSPEAAGGSDTGAGLVLEPDAEQDSHLEFTTILPALAQEEGAGPAFGEVSARIGYSVETAEDGTRQLVRSDSRITATGGRAEEPPDVVLEKVTRFRVQLSPDGKSWEDTWTGQATSNKDTAPRMAAIEVGWQVGESRGKAQERFLRTAVPIYGTVQ